MNINTIKEKIEMSKVLIFDFDGVIADSNEVKAQAFAELYKSYGEEIIARVLEHHRKNGGMSRFEKFKYYHGVFLGQDLNKEALKQLSTQFSNLVFNKVVSSSEIKSSTKFIQRCFELNKVCVINSATPQTEIKKIIKARGLEIFFSDIFGSPSTKLENIAKILKINKCGKDRVVLFGDSEADLLAADEAGVYFVGIGNDILQTILKHKFDYPYLKDFSKITHEY
jgi:phosphoglycolate phosphatase